MEEQKHNNKDDSEEEEEYIPTDEEEEEDDDAEITREVRDLSPAHYIFKIEKFSRLSKAKVDNFQVQSSDFEVGRYKWRLSLYPKGNQKRNGDGYISLYLRLCKSNEHPFNQEISVNFKLFVYNHIEDNYVVFPDSVKRFRGIKPEWGFDRLVPLSDFKKTSNGYLMDDCCIFGAEVFIIENANKVGCLSMVKEPANNTYSWTIHDFASLDQEYYQSQEFVIGDCKWTILIYPKGDSEEKGKNLSIILQLEDYATKLDYGGKVYAEFILRVRDQVNGKHFESQAYCEFDPFEDKCGFRKNISLIDLNDSSKRFILENTLIVDVKIIEMTVFKEFS